MELIIVTGMSGAGKSRVVAALEDMFFYCVDNIPPELIHNFVDVCKRTKISKIALVADVRGGILFESLMNQLQKLSDEKIDYKILFLDADDDVIISRYKETRRKHPLISKQCKTISEAVAAEREKLEFFKMMASFVIDTSHLSVAQLKERIGNLFLREIKDGIVVNCLSFGFKNGVPHDIDLVFDVRFLPNPFYIPELKYRTGLEQCVRDYVMKSDEAKSFEKKLMDMLDFLLPLYQKEGKSQLVVAFGCTGGKHRSVTFAHITSEYLKKKKYSVFVSHRDIDKQ